jgi:hypothetical protein
MDKVFSQLNVIKTKTSRRRASSMMREGRQASEALSPDRMQIPVKNSTKTQQHIWEVIEKRVRGIKFQQQVDISKEAAAAMNLPPAQLVHEIEPIARGLAQASEMNLEDLSSIYAEPISEPSGSGSNVRFRIVACELVCRLQLHSMDGGGQDIG